MNQIPLVTCTMIFNEAPYIKEWIEFHKLMGVSKFYFYNNSSTDNTLEVLQPYILAGEAEVTDWPVKPPFPDGQQGAFKHFVEGRNQEKVWAAFIDVDEFLFAPQAKTVMDILNQIPHACGIGVHWMCFGSGGQDEYIDLPVLERFHLRSTEFNDDNRFIKPLIRLDQKVIVENDPHIFNVENGTFDELGRRLTCGRHEHTSKILRVNHYKTNSKGEWLSRQRHKQANLPGAPQELIWDSYNIANSMEIDDRTIQRYLPELKKQLQKR